MLHEFHFEKNTFLESVIIATKIPFKEIVHYVFG